MGDADLSREETALECRWLARSFAGMLEGFDPLGNSERAAAADQAVTEQEWMESTDPTPMVEFLRCKRSEWKLRLHWKQQNKTVSSCNQ